jgi:hypothetical protein
VDRQREEQVAQLFFALFLRSAVRPAKLAQFLFDLRPRVCVGAKVEAGGGGLLLGALRAQEGRQRLGHAVERGGRGLVVFAAAIRFPAGFALGALGGFPRLLHVFGRLRRFFAKDVRVAADELARLAAQHRFEREASGLLGDAAVEEAVQEQVPQLALQCVRVPGVDGGGDLVGFLQRQVAGGGVRLLAVPRAVAPQLAHDGHELGERLGQRVGRTERGFVDGGVVGGHSA